MRWSHAGLAAACCAAVLTAGCSGADAGAREDVREDARDDARLPAGVIPPSGAAVPGQAELGPDGLYDYAGVPDFVPANPCEGEWRAAASAAGYEHREGDMPSIANPLRPSCVLSQVDGTQTILTGDHRGRREYAAEGLRLIDNNGPGNSWYSVRIPTDEQTGLCRAAIDTPTGSVGVILPYSETSPLETPEEVCEQASAQFLEIWGTQK